MRHFAHHIGDYAAATAHLTFMEDAAYHRLLRLYYQNERPLPVDENEIMRRVRAVSRSEKNAVRRILSEFFILSSDGWHQSRADTEISKFKHLVEAGRQGGLKSRLPSSLRSASRRLEATTTHKPLPKDKIPRQARKTKLPEDWQPTEELLAYAAEQGCVDPKDTAERFRLHHQSKGTRWLNWAKAFQYWCRNEKNFKRAPTNGFASPAATVAHDTDAQWKTRLRTYRVGGFWQSGNWGPRPESGKSIVPARILEEWREAQPQAEAA